MAITRWDPFRDVLTMQNRLNSLFQDYNREGEPVSTASFVPPVDIYEDDHSIVLKLEVPGMKQGGWTDIYALAASIHYAILGKTPPPAVGRLRHLVALGQQRAPQHSPHGRIVVHHEDHGVRHDTGG